MENIGNFNLKLSFLKEDNFAVAEVAGKDYKNPMLTWIQLVFADDKPNANKQGIAQSEFDNLIESMRFMPIKADYDVEAGLGGHSGATIIGTIKAGKQLDNTIVAVGALYNAENPDIIDYFKEETANGNSIEFSWEIRFKDSEIVDGIEWLQETTAKAITAVADPAYEGRTPMVSLSGIEELVRAIDLELEHRRETVEVK